MICWITTEVPFAASLLPAGVVLWLFKLSRWSEFAEDFEKEHGRAPTRSAEGDREAFEEWRMTYHADRRFRPALHLSKWILAAFVFALTAMTLLGIAEQCPEAVKA